MRNGRSHMQCLNSICYDFKLAALKIDTNDIWRPHCDNIPAEPTVYCAGLSTGVTPIQSGHLFVVNGSPNPFRGHFDVSFVLPQAGHVTVEVFAADGRRVGVLADEDMAAGQHVVTWNVGRSMPSGMYFYKVRSGEAQSTGKVTRVD
jgi:hypothetical protein